MSLREVDLRTQQCGMDTAVLRGLLALDREQILAKPLLVELQAGRRKWSELSADEKRLLEGAPLIEYLLAQSLELRYTDPAGMVEFAEAARLVVERVRSRRYGRRVLADLRAQVWAELGNAYRVADDLAAAEAAFAQAAKWARRGTGSRQLVVRLEELAAWLYSDLRRFPEAAAMLDRTAEYYSMRGDARRVGRTMISRGLVTGYANEPELAVVFLLRGLRLIGPEEGESGLRLAAIHALALNLVEAGHCASARALLEKNERLYRRGGKLNKLRLHWLKGKIAHGLGELGRAEADFHVARLGFKRVEKNYDAALVSLDLALLYARQGKRLATLRLVDEMVETFRTLRIAREAIASLLLLRRACGKGEDAPAVLCAQIRTIASLVAELQRTQPRVRKGTA
jgi:tetratricopeptide (TPR) repeat protein